MINLEDLNHRITESFEAIRQGAMADVPILNHALSVEVVGLHDWNGRAFGIIITPWLMNFIIVGNEGDDWGARAMGDKVTMTFPAGEFDFLVNHFEGVGPCLTYGIQSPMSCFGDQAAAMSSACNHLDKMMVEVEEEDTSEEDEKLRRFLAGEENALSNVAEATQTASADDAPSEGVSRRGLLRGKFSSASQNS